VEISFEGGNEYSWIVLAISIPRRFLLHEDSYHGSQPDIKGYFLSLNIALYIKSI
jgi:hypothetical protein